MNVDRLRPRSVRARLVVVYTAAAAVIAVVAGVVFTVQLDRGLRGSVDASLTDRAAPLVTSLQQTGPADLLGPDSYPRVRDAGGTVRPASAALVYAPDGHLAAAAPASAHTVTLPPEAVHAARTRRVHITVDYRDKRYRVLLQPARYAGAPWVVAVADDMAQVDDAAGDVRLAIYIGSPVLVAAVAAGAWLLAGAAFRPIERLRSEAGDLGTHDPTGRLSVPATGDEVAALAVTFNELLDRLHRSLAQQQALVADAGHDLRTPLAVLQLELDLARHPGLSRAELRSAIEHAHGETQRLSRLAEDLLFLARADSAQPVVLLAEDDLAALVRNAVRTQQVAAQQAGVAVSVAAPERCVADIDATALRRAVDNVLTNAIHAADTQVVVDVSLGATHATIAIRDDGPGFPPAFIEHAFERFRRADTARTAVGSGLGLAIAHQITQAHGGTAHAANLPGGGACVTLAVPLRAAHDLSSRR